MKAGRLVPAFALLALAGCGWHYQPFYVKAGDPALAACRTVAGMNLPWVQGEIDYSPQADEEDYTSQAPVPLQEIPVFAHDADVLAAMSTPHAWFNADLSGAALSLREAVPDLRPNASMPQSVSGNVDRFLPDVVHDCRDFTVTPPVPVKPGTPWYDWLFLALSLYITGYVLSAFAIAKLDRSGRTSEWLARWPMPVNEILGWCLIWFLALPCAAACAFFRWLPKMMAWYALSPAERKQRRQSARDARTRELERENGM